MLGSLTREEILEMLEKSMIGRIGCNDGERTYIVPVSYVFQGDHVLCHSRDGLKIQMMRKNPFVCFELDDIRDYSNWRSVVAWGYYEELTEDKDIEHSQQFFSDVRLDMKVSRTSMPPEAMQERQRIQKPMLIPSVFYRIRFTEITGRFEKQV